MTGKFIITKEHRRFTEFANVVRKEHTIGICYGDAGVGKTMSGRRYANWDTIEPHLGGHFGPRNINDKVVAAISPPNDAHMALPMPDVPQISNNRPNDSWPHAQRATARSSKRQSTPRPQQHRYPQASPPQRGFDEGFASAPAQKPLTRATQQRGAQAVPRAGPQRQPPDPSP